jgi:Ca2+-binding EF-hand superfamily protein
MSGISFTPPPPPPPPVDNTASVNASLNSSLNSDFSRSLFDQMNSNTADAGVSQQEFASYLQSQGIDVDQDSLQEAFEAADDGDGFLSYQEMEAAWNDFEQLGSANEASYFQNEDAEEAAPQPEQGSGGAGKSEGGKEAAQQGGGSGKSEGSEQSGGSEKAEGAGSSQGTPETGNMAFASLADLWKLLLGKYDKDGDGKLDAEELDELKAENPELGEKLEGIFEKAGIDASDGVTQEELQGAIDSGDLTDSEVNTLSGLLEGNPT